tara:strand:- start:8154 stop:8330 length:177 start_codon:yes stop_codon:yes gene_type:complete
MKESELFLWSLLIVFITLKLTNIIIWSWWLVFAPLWGPGALILIIYLPLAIIEKIKKK